MYEEAMWQCHWRVNPHWCLVNSYEFKLGIMRESHAELVSAPHHKSSPLKDSQPADDVSPDCLSRADLTCGVPKQVRHDWWDVVAFDHRFI
jgi:hypothetical protein